MRSLTSIILFLVGTLLFSNSRAQESFREEAGLFAPSAWDLELGAHASELSVNDYIDYACGTNGGPPSLPLSSWSDFGMCPPEPETGFHEVYFQYDDENEYWAKANEMHVQIRIFEHTSVYQIPIIASALFDPLGFLVGIRMVTDDRMPVDLRENNVSLSNFLRARHDNKEWTCEDLPRIEGETPFQGVHEKQRCRLVPDDKIHLMIETHNYRKPGQYGFDPRTRRATEGQFVSSTAYEEILLNAMEGQGRDVPEVSTEPSERDLLIARAMNCPGCDFQEANFKRADLRGANLEGANLYKANLHGAYLGGANLSKANLEKANLNRADVKRANLDGANIQEAMMFEARFDGASLVDADLTLTNAGKVHFIRANLTNARMVAMDLRHGRMNDAIFINADLSGSLLYASTFNRSDLTDVTILQADMTAAQMVKANLTRADLRATWFLKADFSRATLTNVDFSSADLSYVNFSGAILDEVIWTNAILPGGFDPIRADSLKAAFQKGLDAYDDSDYATALLEWTPLAEQGHVSAQFNLALMYHLGKGVPQDNIYAYMWADFAAANGKKLGKSGDDVAKELLLLKDFAIEMTPADISAAQNLVRDCINKNYKNC